MLADCRCRLIDCHIVSCLYPDICHHCLSLIHQSRHCCNIICILRWIWKKLKFQFHWGTVSAHASSGKIFSWGSLNHTHTRLTALFPGLPGWAGTRKVKPIWILLKQETVSGNGISWAICKSAPHSRQVTMPAPHHSVFYRPDALPAAQPTASKHWRHFNKINY